MLFNKKGETDTIHTVSLPTNYVILLYRLVKEEADKNKASFSKKQHEVLTALTQRAYDDKEAEKELFNIQNELMTLIRVESLIWEEYVTKHEFYTISDLSMIDLDLNSKAYEIILSILQRKIEELCEKQLEYLRENFYKPEFKLHEYLDSINNLIGLKGYFESAKNVI
jgi:hypothetical protein